MSNAALKRRLEQARARSQHVLAQVAVTRKEDMKTLLKSVQLRQRGSLRRGDQMTAEPLNPEPAEPQAPAHCPWCGASACSDHADLDGLYAGDEL